MAPEMLGAARLTRYSFSRMLLRTVAREGWTAERAHFDLDERGQGEAIYCWEIDGRPFHFVAFTRVLDESLHTDRVVADEWEISAALVEGMLDHVLLESLRHNVPRQEKGRLDDRVLVLTRGNRSVRFFDYLVDTLANGEQPDPTLVGDAGYIMRSTAFYGNGKFGMRSFDTYEPEHPFAIPYRAQFAAAFFFRELSYDSVEHCARLRGGDRAVEFDDEWRRFFGLGNATGLGLVPYAFNHPAVMHAWASVREIALADVRAMPATPELVARLDGWIERARVHFAGGTDDDCTPFLSPAELVPLIDEIAAARSELGEVSDLFERLYLWAEERHPEAAELVVSLLIELHDADDTEVDAWLSVDEDRGLDPTLTVGEVRELLDRRFPWLDDLRADAALADAYWWVVSDNNEEPRRVRRDRMAPEGRDVAIDIANRLRRLRSTLETTAPDRQILDVVREHADHAHAVRRVVTSRHPYGEPRDNACALEFLPLQTQRFQLAFYGMDNFKPKSTDWLRVTLFQGAPRLADVDAPAVIGADDWVLPALPSAGSSS
ncbi:MAG: hypothetical protein AAF567_02495 [Actinomycetota bacterium]